MHEAGSLQGLPYIAIPPNLDVMVAGQVDHPAASAASKIAMPSSSAA